VTAISLLRKPATTAYRAVRVPFALVENRLPQSSKIRAGLAAAITSVDSWIGEHGREEGTSRTEAPVPSQSPAQESAPDPWQDEEAARAAIEEAVRERQPEVGELADPDLDVAEVQAQLQAKHALEERQRAEAERSDNAAGSGTAPQA
jgi:hypothetical protein